MNGIRGDTTLESTIIEGLFAYERVEMYRSGRKDELCALVFLAHPRGHIETSLYFKLMTN